MANTFFKSLTESDRTSSRTLLHEAIPITGTLVSGTYNTRTDTDSAKREDNIKTFSHGMFQSVYDYPFASSSANHIFDITTGVAPFIPSASVGGFQAGYTAADQLFNQVVTASGEGVAKKKRAIYNQMAQVLVGYDTSGSIRLFDSDGNFAGNDLGDPGTDDTLTANDATAISKGKILDPIFINFSRLLTKDEIKKGSFSMDIGAGATGSNEAHLANRTFERVLNVADTGAESSYFINSPAGEYGLLKISNKVGTPVETQALNQPCGLIYYQAGIAVLDGSKLFRVAGSPKNATNERDVFDQDGFLNGAASPRFTNNNISTWTNYWISSSIDTISDGVRRRIQNISFNNTTELNSTIYFCRANHNEFNYSSNNTYLSGSQIRVKASEVLNPPKSYVTTVGMYSADNELLAVAKLSEPLRKDPTNELTLRVRLDY